jgi:RND family efflux transporter MFP subunit
MKVIKRIVFILVLLVLFGGALMVLQQNKARSEAKQNTAVARPFAVSVAQARQKEVTTALTLVGTVAPNREVAVASETAGRVVAVSLSQGDFKGASSVLVAVDDELRRIGVQMAEVTLAKAKKDLERFEIAQTENALPDQQLDMARFQVKQAESALATARRQLRDTRIVAPFGGVIVNKLTEVGAMVQPGMVVANMVDVSVLKVKVNVSEKDVFGLHVGERVEVSSDVHQGVSYNGTISSIGAKGDEAHTYPVEILVNNNASSPLRAGMFARVRFASIPKRTSTVIPRTAIVGSVKEPKVYVVRNGVAYGRQILVGEDVGTDVEVVRGLMPGDEIVVSGQNNLRDSMTVEVVK